MKPKKGAATILMLFSKYRDNDDMVLNAIQEDALSLRHASNRIKKNINIVMTAVCNNEYAFCYAHQTLRCSPEVTWNAVQADWRALRFVSKDQKENVNLVLAAIAKNGGALKYASKILRNDETVVLAAIKNQVSALQFASKSLQESFKPVIEASAILQTLKDAPVDDRFLSSLNVTDNFFVAMNYT